MPSGAATTGVFLLLFMGNFGHNLFRFSWVWYGGFLIIARHCIHRRLVTGSHDPLPEEPEEDETPPPDGWVEHDAHPAAGHGPFAAAR